MSLIEKDEVHQFFFSAKKYSRDTNFWLEYIRKLENIDSIRNTYKELFSIPRPDMEKAWSSYESWEKDQEFKEIMREVYLKFFTLWLAEEESYKSALILEKFSVSDLKSYFETIKEPQQQYVYEEILLKHSKNSEIWTEYVLRSFRCRML